MPIPPQLVALLRQHLGAYGTAGDARLFAAPRGALPHESCYGRTWHAARTAALGPALATTGLARRPYDLRHAALSLWLDASSAPAQVAARAGNSVRVLQAAYARCVDGHADIVSQQIEHALGLERP